MNKKTLEDYKKLDQDIRALSNRIGNLRNLSANYEYGSAKGSNPEFPYQPMTFHVSGYNIQDDEKKRIRIKSLEMKLEEQKKEAEEKRIAVEEFIAGIEDTTLRLIFTYLFLNGMNQEEVGRKLCMDRTSVSKKVTDYLQVSHNSQLNVI